MLVFHVLRFTHLPYRSPSLHTEAPGTPPPDAFGPFRVLHQIGAGTLGPVFRAYDAERERLVAVKVFTLDLPPDRAHRLVAELERLVAADLTHPSIAAPLATGITGVSAYLAQDYVAADSLDVALRQYGPSSPADALGIAARLAGALDFAAVADISHGALHPRDVLTSSDETRLTGTGVARALEQIGVTAPVRRPYSAPERMAGAAWDRRADVFSLAAVMHEVLWGRRVSGAGAQAIEGLTDIAGADLVALSAAFTRALAEEPGERFETVLEFAEALKAAFPDVTLTAPAPPKRRRPREPEPTLPLDPLPLHPSAASVAEAPLFIVPPSLDAQQAPSADLDLATADDLAPAVDCAPAVEVRVREAPEPPPPAVVPAGLITGSGAEPASMLERSRSAVWPLGLAMGVGLAIGFAGGYGFGTRERTVSPSAPALPGREFTERAVAEPIRVEQPEVRLPPAPVEKTPDPPAPAAPKAAPTRAAGPGRLVIRSTPAGAQVSVNGHEAGKTPVSVGELALGAHRIQLTHEGFAPAERRVTITRRRSSQSIAVTLAAARTARAAGTLSVESRPAGAKVYIDGRLVGTTPLSHDIPAGEHGVRIDLAGYRGWTSSVRVAASETSRVTASLER